MTDSMTLAQMFVRLAGHPEGVRFEGYDGSVTGPEQARVTVRVVAPVAVEYILRAPSDLGLARAFVTGALDVEGDLAYLITVLLPRSVVGVPLREVAALAPALGQLLPMAFSRPPIPEIEAPSRWRRGLRRHTKGRDAEAIAHHYDVSNAFYEMVLGPSMTYTCAVFPTVEASLEQAQAAKYDLVARKLDLQPGMRLLDVGCGWGGMVMHAAEKYDVRAIGVTLSRQQAEWASKVIAERGLSDRAEVRHLDYRDLQESSFDAISSIGLTEHIGQDNLKPYFRGLYDRLRPEGRLLNHCITRPGPGRRAKAKAFIDRYVFPDGELESPGYIFEAMNGAGFECRHTENLREHYAMTLRDWGRNLDERWDDAVAEVGVLKARAWRLYMAASRAGFDSNQIQLHQFLGVRLGRSAASPGAAVSGFPLRPSWLS
ncbi:MAG: cyclopropane-fatty-acyl-phospholipid synthase family protein [Actinomycetes bacterium]